MRAASTKMTHSLGCGEEGVCEQGGGGGGERELGDLHHPPAVDRVGDGAADERASQKR